MRSRRPKRLYNDKILMPDVYPVPEVLSETQLESLSSLSREYSSGSSEASSTTTGGINHSTDFKMADEAVTLMSCLKGGIEQACIEICRVEKYLNYSQNLQENLDTLGENVEILQRRAEICFGEDYFRRKHDEHTVGSHLDRRKWWPW